MGKLHYSPLFGRAVGPATKLDADGNPTPNFLRVPGSNRPFPDGTLYYADEYPADMDGSMEFIWDGGRWRWCLGKYYWDRTGFGHNRRWANGDQEHTRIRFPLDTVESSTTIVGNMTFPAPFISAPYGINLTFIPPSNGDNPNQFATNSTATTRGIGGLAPGLLTTTGMKVGARTLLGSGETFTAGDVIYVSAKALGRWR